MTLLFRVVLIAVSLAVSWWVLLKPPTDPVGSVPAELMRDIAILLDPLVADKPPPPPPPAAESAAPPAAAEPSPAPAAPPEMPPAPPEAGAPDGEEEEKASAPVPEEPAKEPEPDLAAEHRSEMAAIESSTEVMQRAEAEVAGKTKKGFMTTFLCAPRDQLAIARYFGEEVVLVPRSGLRKGREHYHRLTFGEGGPKIEKVGATAPLERYRRYRDLFAFSYESLPEPLRELRRRVFVRGDIYLFAALIPPREWGLVIVRRDAALAAASAETGRSLSADDVRVFTMRYVALPRGAFDIQVAEIQFADGTRWRAPGQMKGRN